ncbi:DNA-(apurinic or apyrimidinic site) lyase /Formamidopyrimidine-DNA glycosylase [Microlunatus soli]|uniref:DNA-(Apurinic or apyrimidinic site) lyase /Formamidopyrimidine-DNA glycosylase n=2 Tax=Microlunatus soli TaxID=630515 RepID=A0A1H1TKI3_9ACTN|nr:DNA-(apurinic or apyrimidinic site) lyase /Formamidopyrimidine-DNA glycosylase [Microlunatus soli]
MAAMPEMPEVESLVRFLDERLREHAIARVELAAFSALKTYDPPLTALHGLEVEKVSRHGKFLDIDAQGVHLVFHLARAGWLRWRDELGEKPLRPGKGPMALRVRLDDDSGFDLTEAGTQRKLAIYVTTDPQSVPGIASLGPDPLADDFTVDTLAALLSDAGRSQLKGVLKDQKVIAGIGNAYSDEILHVAKLSPFKPANSLTDVERSALFVAIKDELALAIKRSEGLAAKDLKAEKKSGMRVHGRAGQTCEVCGDTIAEVSFADSSMQYCPTCQTGGKKLADRRMSRLLK